MVYINNVATATFVKQWKMFGLKYVVNLLQTLSVFLIAYFIVYVDENLNIFVHNVVLLCYYLSTCVQCIAGGLRFL